MGELSTQLSGKLDVKLEVCLLYSDPVKNVQHSVDPIVMII